MPAAIRDCGVTFVSPSLAMLGEDVDQDGAERHEPAFALSFGGVALVVFVILGLNNRYGLGGWNAQRRLREYQ